MPEQLVVKCTQCGNVYSARNAAGQFVLKTESTGCSCGSASFVEDPAPARSVEP